MRAPSRRARPTPSPPLRQPPGSTRPPSPNPPLPTVLRASNQVSRLCAALSNNISESRRLDIALVAVSSPLHYTLWNALAAESLAGDLQGCYPDRVGTRIYRVRSGPELETISHHLLATRPDIIGISTECGGLDLSLDLAARLRPWLASHRKRLIFGGKLPSQIPGSFLARFPEALVVIGEGELPLREIVKVWLDSGTTQPNFHHIANLAYVANDAQVVRTKEAPPDCGELRFPPALDTVGEILDAGGGTVLVQASRGCSWAGCSYCAVSPFRRHKTRERLPWERTRRHLESLTWLGAREFEFCDDDFFGDRENLDHIATMAEDLRKLWPSDEFPRGSISFRIFLTPGTVFRSDDPAGNKRVLHLLKQLKQVGLARAYLGIESGSAQQLKRYGRQASAPDALRALDILRKDLALGVDCGFLMFDPDAILEDIRLNLQFFEDNSLLAHNQWPFRAVDAYDGAALAKQLRSLAPFDPSYLAYRYRYRDPAVGRVADAVDQVAAGSAPLFYALKTISKAHFSPEETASQALECVKQNGQIYLRLLRDLVEGVSTENTDAIAAAQRAALESLRKLVDNVAGAVAEGKLPDPYGRLTAELVALQARGALGPSSVIDVAQSRVLVTGQKVEEVSNDYAAAAAAVFSTLGRLQEEGRCPALLCLPDLLILQKSPVADTQDGGERIEVPPEELQIDGHATLGAFTASYLCPCTAGDFDVFLAARTGGQGHTVLKHASAQVRQAGAMGPRIFPSDGDDRVILVGRDGATKVNRQITARTANSDLRWTDIEDSGVLGWLRYDDRPYGLLLGDAEWDPGPTGRRRLCELAAKAKITVVDTVYWDKDPKRAVRMWNWIQDLVKTQGSATVISVSDEDAPNLFSAVHGETVGQGFQSACTAARRLAETLPSGHVLLHGKSANVLFARGMKSIHALRVPACDIEPKSTNGAGDTFNGAFTFAALCLAAGSDHNADGRSPKGLMLQHALSFATAVVSLRLATGRFATRDFVETGSRRLKAREDLGAMRAIVRAPVASRPGPTGFPKLAFVDLDYTLCDSMTWRETAARRAIAQLLSRANNLGSRKPPADRLLALYGAVYRGHDTWEHVLGVNPRYNWYDQRIFAALLILDEMLGPLPRNEKRLNEELLRLATAQAREIMHRVKQPVVAAREAEEAFMSTQAVPYADAVAGLHRLRNELGYKLFLVTDGDTNMQAWKLGRLGLGDFFSKNPDSEAAIASEREVAEAFTQAIGKTSTNKDEVTKLHKAQKICQKWAAEVKSCSRLTTLAKILDSEAASSGVFVCTIGDRHDTDIVPYHIVRRPDEGNRAKAVPLEPGLLTFRLKRGPYCNPTLAPGLKDADHVVPSWAGVGAVLARAGFWRDREPLKAEAIRARAADLPPTPDEVTFVKDVANRCPDIDYMVQNILEHRDR